MLADDGACLARVEKTQMPAMQKCNEDFQKAVHKDPRKVCSALQTLVDCVDNLYATCGAGQNQSIHSKSPPVTE